MEWKTTALSWRKGSWNEKPRRFPRAKDYGMKNHGAFLEQRIMGRETMTLSWQKGSWNRKPDPFPQERIVALKFIEFRSM